jgi:EAL and modified HD-GYP domain-containing signal transduction protein
MLTTVGAQLPAFVGRQPIFDRGLRTFAYELLFRLAAHNHAVAAGADGTAYTAQVVLNTFVEIGLDNVVGGTVAFINATRSFLCDGLALQLPRDRVVIEVLEDITPDEPVLAAVARLRESGYTIALDDFVYHPALAPLVDLADIVKIDLSRQGWGELERHLARLRRPGITFLAEKIETRDQFDRCRDLGFDYFQGFFLARPTVVQGRKQTSSEFAALRLLSLLEDPSASVSAVEAAISLDPTLSYRLLQVINSAAFSVRHRVDSLRQALILLGLQRVQGWVTLMVLAGLSRKPPVLLETALTRARMCEKLGARLEPNRGPSYFTVGLFSTLEAMLDCPLPQLIGQLPLSPDVSAALLHGTGDMGRVLSVVLAYERCEWEHVRLDPLSGEEIRNVYLDTIQWVRQAVDRQRTDLLRRTAASR